MTDDDLSDKDLWLLLGDAAVSASAAAFLVYKMSTEP